jgi:HD-like signal output (HDOD) protein
MLNWILNFFGLKLERTTAHRPAKQAIETARPTDDESVAEFGTPVGEEWADRTDPQVRPGPAAVSLVVPPIPTPVITAPVEEIPRVAPPKPAAVVLGPWAGSVTPWDQDSVVLSLKGKEVRAGLKEELSLILGQTERSADKKFLLRLAKLVDSDQLDLPPFPDIAQELDALLKDRHANVVQIAKIVERDAGLVRRVWNKASGAMYATRPKSLHHAVARIGLDSLWRIGMSVCMNEDTFRARGYQDVADAVRTHGVVTAEVAAWIGNERRGPLYMSGLLHDVGKLIVYQAASTRALTSKPSQEVVHMVADACHAPLGVLVAKMWRLDDMVATGVGYHHNPDMAPERMQRVARVVQAANIASHAAAEERAGRDCGGIDALRKLPGLIFNPAKAIAKAHDCYNQVGAEVELPAEMG